MKMTNKLVKDYLGNLIPKSKAHKIMGKYYEENVSCFLMEDGQRYRITSTDKIVYDHYNKKWVLKGNRDLVKGIINTKGEVGLFSANDFMIRLINLKSKLGNSNYCLNEEIALKMGYIESLSDGGFYKLDELDENTKSLIMKKAIPNNERSKNYNLESDQERKKELEKFYKDLNIRVEASSVEIARIIGDFSFGMEVEVINGHIPKRIRSKYGLKALKDGSLRHDGGEGIEYVTVPMSGAKGIQVIKEVLREATKRCEVNNLCSVHFHFGNVRKDKLFVLSLYNVIRLIQDELVKYFPYSRVNSIKPDGKVYCSPLPDLKINHSKILAAKDEETFHKEIVIEFNKIYTWLNNGKPLAEEYAERSIVRETIVRNGKKMFHDRWLKNIYTTKSTYHSVQGQKWDKPQRYMMFNLLNLFFSKIGTIESRLHEGSTNVTKVLSWMLITTAIIKYAENINVSLAAKKLELKDVLQSALPAKYADYLMEYLKSRHKVFFNENGEYRSYKSIEKTWFNKDPEYRFIHNGMEIK